MSYIRPNIKDIIIKFFFSFTKGYIKRRDKKEKVVASKEELKIKEHNPSKMNDTIMIIKGIILSHYSFLKH